MANITVRNLDDALKTKLRVRAARSGRSMAEEVRMILRSVLEAEEIPVNLGKVIHQRVAALGGLELPPVSREEVRDPGLFA